jgi:hypothetical protein
MKPSKTGRSVNANEVVASIYDDRRSKCFTLTNAQYGRMATDADPLLGRKVEVSWSVGGAEYVWPASSTGSARAWPPSGVVSRFRPDRSEADNPVQLRPGAFVR